MLSGTKSWKFCKHSWSEPKRRSCLLPGGGPWSIFLARQSFRHDTQKYEKIAPWSQKGGFDILLKLCDGRKFLGLKTRSSCCECPVLLISRESNPKASNIFFLQYKESWIKSPCCDKASLLVPNLRVCC